MVKLKKDCNTGGCDNVFSCCYWKEKINKAWELATTSVRSIKVNGGAPQYPDGDGAVDVLVTVDTTEIQDQLDAISSEVDQLTSDVLENSTDIINLSNLKENVLSAGDGIDIDRASSSTPIISTNVVAQNSDGMFSVWKDESKIAELTEGTNVTISPTGVVSAVDTKYTAGANVTITADNVISATGELSGTASASQILLEDNRSVQSAIDAIEDEIGDSTTGGTILDRLDTLESTTTNLDAELAGKQDTLSDSQLEAVNSGATKAKIDSIAEKQDALSTTQLNAVNSGITSGKVTNYDGYATEIANLKAADVDLSKAYSEFSVDKSTSGKIGLTMSAVDGMTSASADLITAGDNISIDNGVISASGSGSDLFTAGSYGVFFSVPYATSTTGYKINQTPSKNILETTVNGFNTRSFDPTGGTIYSTKITCYDIGLKAYITRFADQAIKVPENFSGTIACEVWPYTLLYYNSTSCRACLTSSFDYLPTVNVIYKKGLCTGASFTGSTFIYSELNPGVDTAVYTNIYLKIKTISANS